MPVSAKVEIVGLKETLREINQINPKLRRQITKDYKAVVSPVVVQAQQTNIRQLALSGFYRNWRTKSGYQMFPLLDTRLPKLVVAGVSGKKPKSFNGRMQNSSVFFIRWKSPQATLLEMAANGNLGENMVRKNGPKGRVLWRAWEQNENEVMKNVSELVDTVMNDISKNLRKR